VENRLFVEAILSRYRVGIPWCDLPEQFGDWKNAHGRFCRWAERGVEARVFQHLSRDADNEYAMIDSTIVWRVSRAPAREKQWVARDWAGQRRLEYQASYDGRGLE